MNRFFKEHMEWALAGVAVLFSLIIIGVFVWGVTFLARHAGTALDEPTDGSRDVRFDIDRARELDLRGLSQ